MPAQDHWHFYRYTQLNQYTKLMQYILLCLTLCVLLTPLTSAQALPEAKRLNLSPSSPGKTASKILTQYLYTPDAAYQYEEKGQIQGEGYTVYFLSMNSLRWRDESQVTPNVWQHWVSVILPDTLLTNKAHLIITGGSTSTDDNNSATPPQAQDLELFTPIAMNTGSVAVVVSQVPSQPLQFTDRPEPLKEDALVAYSWRKFIETGDPTWAAYLPMTKAAVRAMDSAQDFLKQTLGLAPDQFIVTGFSKRGATAWLTAAMDSRVMAVVPGVFNVLGFAQHVENQYRNYSQYAPAIEDYANEGLLQQLRSPEGQLLTGLVDPINYVKTLTMPHYILQASGDEFFLPDASASFIGRIPGEVTQRIVPNEDHSLTNQLQANLSALIAWYQSILLNVPRPQLQESVDDQGTLTIRSSQAPIQAKLWQAHNPDIRDFRFETIGPAWTASTLSADSNGAYHIDLLTPNSGYTAYLVEFTYPGPAGLPQQYTSNTYITPNTRPFVLSNPIKHPRKAKYWQAQVRAAQLGKPLTYTQSQLQDLLPIRVLGRYIKDVDTLAKVFKKRHKAHRKAQRQCTAARLNVEAEQVGWYSPLAPMVDYWRVYQLAEKQYAQGHYWAASKICRKLSKL